MQMAAAPTTGTFSWQQQWYPLAPVSYLPQDRPTATTVLGRRLVVWWHAPSRSWRAFEDRCAHRLAPLSEGRLEPVSGNLQCTLHGWEFGPEGRCERVPQADSPQQGAAACRSARACVATFPVQEEQLRPAPDGGTPGVLLGDWYMRDLPVSFDSLLENLLDPAHVHWAHHGVIGSRSRGGPVQLNQEGSLTAQDGFRLRLGGQRAPGSTGSAGSTSGMPAATHFVPPSLVWLEMPTGGRGHFSMLFYAVPVSPTSCRFFAGYSTDAVPASVRRLLQPAGALAPVLHAFQFLGDLGAHEVVDGDLIHIFWQEQALRREGGGWRRAYFMPARADRGVVLLRRWLDELAGGGPEYPGRWASAATQPLIAAAGSSQGRALSRREILDRYEQHTRHCPSCRRALATVQATRQALQLAAATGFASAFTLVLIQALLPGPPLGLAPGGRAGGASLPLMVGAAALTAGLGAEALRRLERSFVFVDYVHGGK
ncbi:hypothetical protein ABPG75_009640 [Micractinium tetrahymenae]